VSNLATELSPFAALVTVALAVVALKYARDTVMIARQAQDDDERRRRDGALCRIEELAEAIGNDPGKTKPPSHLWWYSSYQDDLQLALTRLTQGWQGMYACRELAHTNDRKKARELYPAAVKEARAARQALADEHPSRPLPRDWMEPIESWENLPRRVRVRISRSIRRAVRRKAAASRRSSPRRLLAAARSRFRRWLTVVRHRPAAAPQDRSHRNR